MAGLSRYDVSDNEVEISTGVLKNKLGIVNRKFLEDLETTLLNDSYSHFLELLEKRQTIFNLSFLFEIHKYFLGTLYTWAGKTRTVDISKDKTLFIPANFLSNALKEFEKILSENSLNVKDSKNIVAEKLAIIHCEFNAIHPFREGNGRTIRLFLDLMVASFGCVTIDYTKTSQKYYIQACVDGMKKDYKRMKNVMYRGLKKRE